MRNAGTFGSSCGALRVAPDERDDVEPGGAQRRDVHAATEAGADDDDSRP